MEEMRSQFAGNFLGFFVVRMPETDFTQPGHALADEGDGHRGIPEYEAGARLGRSRNG